MDLLCIEKEQKRFFAAANLAMSIGEDGGIPYDYKKSTDYKTVGFKNELYGFSSGDKKIHRVYVGCTDKEIIVSVRGTDGGWDWLNNFDVRTVDFEGMGEVHSGFASAANSLLESGLVDKIKELYTAKPSYPLYFVGHSKGGAVSVLLALHFCITENLAERIHVVTFGAPRVGKQAFSDKFASTGIPVMRYESYLDLIPHIPLTGEEHQLLDRMGMIENILQNVMRIAGEYRAVGDRIGFFVPHSEYNGRYPRCEGNEKKESLNSLCAIEYMLRNHGVVDFDLVTAIHTHDYAADAIEYVDVSKNISTT